MIAVIVGALIAAVAYYMYFAKPAPAVLTITIGSKRFTEQYILGHLMAELIERNTPYKLVRMVGLGGTSVCHDALVRGNIQIYAEYTGTGLLAILKMNWTPGTSPEEIYKTVAKEYESRWKLIWLNPFGFSNTYCIAMRREQAEALGVKKISDLAPYAKDLVFGGTPEFEQRPDGYPGLTQTYGFSFKEYIAMDPGLMYIACSEKKVDVIAAFATDARIPYYDLVVLKDDKLFFPPYYAAPVVRADLLEKAPEIKDLLNKLGGKSMTKQ